MFLLYTEGHRQLKRLGTGVLGVNCKKSICFYFPARKTEIRGITSAFINKLCEEVDFSG